MFNSPERLDMPRYPEHVELGRERITVLWHTLLEPKKVVDRMPAVLYFADRQLDDVGR